MRVMTAARSLQPLFPRHAANRTVDFYFSIYHLILSQRNIIIIIITIIIITIIIITIIIITIIIITIIIIIIINNKKCFLDIDWSLLF